MATLHVHFKSILFNNFDPFREPLAVRFVSKGDRSIGDFSIRYVDGFAKGLICQAIAAIVDHLVSRIRLKLLNRFSPFSLPKKVMKFDWNQKPFLSVPMSFAQGLGDEDLVGDDLQPLLLSLRFFKARYVHMANPEGFFYEALRPQLNGQSYCH